MKYEGRNALAAVALLALAAALTIAAFDDDNPQLPDSPAPTVEPATEPDEIVPVDPTEPTPATEVHVSIPIEDEDTPPTEEEIARFNAWRQRALLHLKGLPTPSPDAR